MFDLKDLGWNDRYAFGFEEFARDGLVPGRVSAQEREGYRVIVEAGEYPATVTGRYHHEARHSESMPAVGDWVAASVHDDFARIHVLLARRTALRRKVSNDRVFAPQVVAANIDVVFLATSANRDFNLRRLERLLTLVWESGAEPVVLVTKADLVDDIAPYVAQAEETAYGVPVHAVSAHSGLGLAEFRAHVEPGRTAALVGTSGVGKSTLTNHLLGTRRMRVQSQRESDDRGRHTTTTRELFVLPDGGCIVDTPGLRTVSLWASDEGLESTFGEIEELAARCRFSDCTHKQEPGCAVREGVDEERLASYHKLQRELAFTEQKADKREAAKAKRKWKTFSKAVRRTKNRNT
ncbi:MAG: ribosome small subunit-dependent GTPase A [Planctomycetota bacterium]